MAPKKAMKMVKPKGLEKPNAKHTGLEKPKNVLKLAMKQRKALAKAKAKGQSSGSKVLEKTKAKNKLNNANLKKLGQMSLQEKVKAAAEEGEDVEHAAELLKASLAKEEHSQVHGRYQTQESLSIPACPRRRRDLLQLPGSWRVKGRGFAWLPKLLMPKSLGKDLISGKQNFRCYRSSLKGN